MTGRVRASSAATWTRGFSAVLLLSLFLPVMALALSDPEDMPGGAPGANPGMRIYREGILPSGEKLRGETSGRVHLSGAMAACAKCHRRSGMGSSEGRTRVRPVTGAALYRPEETLGTGTHKTLPGKMPIWSVYTDETLARAIRDGVDPAGRRFDAAMPRYDLANADLALLIGYLKSLSTTGAPGVTNEVIRFATVVDAKVSPARRNAVIDVLRTFFRDKNAGMRNEGGRARAASLMHYRKVKAYRIWELDVWELSGSEDTWEAQLDAFYRSKPVFALLSGVSARGWEPVHLFSERRGIPCLFPNSDVPVVSGPGHFTVYFSRGVMLEADALARHLGGGPEDLRRGPVVQVYRDDEVGRAAAGAFRKALAASGMSELRDVRLPAAGDPPERILEEAQGGDRPATGVLWLPGSDVRRLGGRPWGASPPGRIYLSSTLAGTAAAAAFGAPNGEVYVVHPFALPKGKGETDRIRTWLAARKVPPGDERLQANAFFAAGIAGDALDRMLDFFSRDYLLEWVERMAEESINPSAYPRLGLGPGQRFGSKGSYILRVAPDGGGFLPVGGWIVPELR
jgi:hypothetical protein